MENLDKVYANKIAEEYAVKKESNVIRLKKLDQKVKRLPFILSLSIGTVFALMFGLGFSMILTDFGFNNNLDYIIGIILGVVGIIMCIANYFIYKVILNKRKAKYAFDIIELANKISENN